MRRTMALASATAAWVLLIQFASTATAPPLTVELPPVDVAREADAPPLPVAPKDTVTVGATTTSHDPPSGAIAPSPTTAAVPSTTTTSTSNPVTTTLAPSPGTTTTAATTTTPPVTTTVVAPATTTTAASVVGAFSPAAESDFLWRINGLRSSVALAGLAANSELNNYARWWAKQMADSGNFSHSDFPSLLDPWWVVAENVGYGPMAAAIFGELVDSSLHYTNMVDARFTSVGIGAYVDPSGLIWTAHVFGG
jgi:uncharacterized protein YkwD